MAAKNTTGVKVTFTGDTSDLDAKLAKLEKEVAATSTEIDAATASTGKHSKSLQEYSTRVNDAGDRLFALADAGLGVTNVMQGLHDGSMLQVGVGLVSLAQSVSVLASDFQEWGKKAWEAGGEVVKAHLASVAAKVQDIAATVAHTVATAASTVATQAMAAAQWALNLAMEANPLLIAVAALALLAVGLYEAYQHIGWFHDAVDKAWQIIQSTFDWIKDHWPLILEILTGPIGLAVVQIQKHWDDIKDGFVYLYNLFVNTGENIFNAIKDPFERAFSWVKAAYDHSIGPIIDSIKDFGGLFGGDINKMAADAAAKEIAARSAGRAAGGPVVGGRSYIVGENGPELFTPGSSGSITPNGAFGGGGTTMHFHIQALDPRAAADAVVAAIQEYESTNGYVPIRRIATTG